MVTGGGGIMLRAVDCYIACCFVCLMVLLISDLHLYSYLVHIILLL